MKHYVISDELEYDWSMWLDKGCGYAWNRLSEQVYRMCEGISVKFHPKTEEEHLELTHDAFVSTLTKIRCGKLSFEPGRAPVFNLLTTTIFRHLYSLKNRNKRGVAAMREYTERFLSNPKVRKSLVPSQLKQACASLSSIDDGQALKYYESPTEI
jgi:hypothetical protein